jgi:hypothetical protein
MLSQFQLMQHIASGVEISMQSVFCCRPVSGVCLLLLLLLQLQLAARQTTTYTNHTAAAAVPTLVPASCLIGSSTGACRNGWPRHTVPGTTCGCRCHWHPSEGQS